MISWILLKSKGKKMEEGLKNSYRFFLIFIVIPLTIVFSVVELWDIYIAKVSAATVYDTVVLGTNGGPTYRLQFNDNITEEISSITTSGAPGAYVTNIIPKDDGNCADYSGQETVLANQTDVNDGATTYRKIVSAKF